MINKEELLNEERETDGAIQSMMIKPKTEENIINKIKKIHLKGSLELGDKVKLEKQIKRWRVMTQNLSKEKKLRVLGGIQMKIPIRRVNLWLGGELRCTGRAESERLEVTGTETGINVKTVKTSDSSRDIILCDTVSHGRDLPRNILRSNKTGTGRDSHNPLEETNFGESLVTNLNAIKTDVNRSSEPEGTIERVTENTDDKERVTDVENRKFTLDTVKRIARIEATDKTKDLSVTDVLDKTVVSVKTDGPDNTEVIDKTDVL